MSSVQAPSLFKFERNLEMVGKRVLITRGPLKGYHGLIKAEDQDGVDVELDATIVSHGQKRQRIKFGDFDNE